MRTLWWRDREYFIHVYTPRNASGPIGAMVSSSPHHLALSAGIRGWRGIVIGWRKPHTNPQVGRHRRCNGFRKVDL